MLGWIRDKLTKRLSGESGQSSRPSSTDIDFSSKPIALSTMHSEDANRIFLHIIFQGEMWVVKIDGQKIISDLLKMAVGHFLSVAQTNVYRQEELASKYKLISVSQKKVLSIQCSVGDEDLKNYDEILLVEKISLGLTVPTKLTIQDIKGPTRQEILAATANLPTKNPIKVVAPLSCQENFQSEIRQVLYSLVEASAKMLAPNLNSKRIFSGIAVRINAKNKKEIDKSAIKYLKDLGFTEAQAKYALRLKRHRQVEAMEWLLENGHRVKEDSDVEESTSSEMNDTSEADPDNPVSIIQCLLRDIRQFHRNHFDPHPRMLDTLMKMGFSEDDAVEALRLTENNQVAACEWLCGERGDHITNRPPGVDTEGPLYKALMANPAIQAGLYNPKVLLAFLSILENPANANLWMNDVDTAPVLGQVFKTYHAEKHVILVNQQMERMRQNCSSVS